MRGIDTRIKYGVKHFGLRAKRKLKLFSVSLNESTFNYAFEINKRILHEFVPVEVNWLASLDLLQVSLNLDLTKGTEPLTGFDCSWKLGI